MGEKNISNVENAGSDMPTFTVSADDPQAADIVSLWATGRAFLEGDDDPRAHEAMNRAIELQAWCLQHTGQKSVSALSLLPFEALAAELRRRGAAVLPAGEQLPSSRRRRQ